MEISHLVAHIADLHLGSHRTDDILSKLEEKTFNLIMDKCVEHQVEIIIISGDLFHNANPDLSTVIYVIKKIKELRDLYNIRFYMVYGSHDYTPGIKSMVDILDCTGLVTNVFKSKIIGDKLYLEFTVDEKTQIKITGIPAMKKGLESQYYEKLYKEHIEKEKGPKIFVFHSSIKEYIKRSDADEAISIENLPKNFDYYAGGHSHSAFNMKLAEYGWIVYPGIPFAILTKKNIDRGFYITEFVGDAILDPTFIAINTCEYVTCECDLSDKNFIDKLNNINFNNKIVDINIKGNINIPNKDKLLADMKNLVKNKRGAIHVTFNTIEPIKNHKEEKEIEIDNDDNCKIENEIFKQKIRSVDELIKNELLKSEYGVQQAIKLLNVIGEDKSPEEAAVQYKNRKIKEGKQSLDILKIV